MARKQQEPEQQVINSNNVGEGDYNESDRFVDGYVADKMKASDGMGLRYDDAQVTAWQAEAREAWSARQDTAAAGRELDRQSEISKEPAPYVADFQSAVEEFADEISVVDNYEKLDDKALLIDKQFLIVQWWFTPSEVGKRGEFVTARLVTDQPVMIGSTPRSKFVITDGGDGIYIQLRQYADRFDGAITKKILCRNGLRVSRYEYQGMPAATYYLT